jgi:hypothetical protein
MTAVAWVFGLFGALAMLLALSRVAAGGHVAAAWHGALSAALVGAAVVVGVLAADLASYEPRVGDRPIAELYFEQVGTRRYRATLTRLPGGRMQVFELVGDTWRIDARTLDFGGWVRAMGGRPGYRLDRLVALERAPGGGAAEPSPTARFALGTRDGFDLWRVSRSSGRWRELVTASDAHSEELPMSGKSRFELTLAGDRIEVQPTGDAAEEMIAEESAAPAR